MAIYEIRIKPESSFGTPFRGDTIFGQVCQIISGLKSSSIDLSELLKDYDKDPFIVTSSAVPFFKFKDNFYYIFKAPNLPNYFFTIDKNIDKKTLIKKRKDFKKKIYMPLCYKKLNISLEEIPCYSKEDLIKHFQFPFESNFVANFIQTHNTINRFTSTTGKDGFAPFTETIYMFNDNIKLSIFIYLGKNIDISFIKDIFEKMGFIGFGKNSSTGSGRFILEEVIQVELSNFGNDNPNCCYTLSPFVPNKDSENFEQLFFTPFIRYGKHGGTLSLSQNPFKNPIIMCDDGAIIKPKNKDIIFSKPFVGVGLENLSKVEKNTRAQGYSLYIPFNIKENLFNETNTN